MPQISRKLAACFSMGSLPKHLYRAGAASLRTHRTVESPDTGLTRCHVVRKWKTRMLPANLPPTAQ